jgi:hypothetical protein
MYSSVKHGEFYVVPCYLEKGSNEDQVHESTLDGEDQVLHSKNVTMETAK